MPLVPQKEPPPSFFRCLTLSPASRLGGNAESSTKHASPAPMIRLLLFHFFPVEKRNKKRQRRRRLRLLQQQQTTKHGGTAARFLGRNRRWSRIFFAWRYSIYTALPPARWRERRSLGSWFGARTRGGGLRCTARDEKSEKKGKRTARRCLPPLFEVFGGKRKEMEASVPAGSLLRSCAILGGEALLRKLSALSAITAFACLRIDKRAWNGDGEDGDCGTWVFLLRLRCASWLLRRASSRIVRSRSVDAAAAAKGGSGRFPVTIASVAPPLSREVSAKG